MPLLDEFLQWLQATDHAVLPKSPFSQAMQYVLPHWDGLIRFCENGALSIDNNLSERMVRPVAIGRNYVNSMIMLSLARSDRGSGDARAG